MLCPNTMPHDRECEPPHVSESYAGSCASTNQTSTITAVSAIPNSIPSTASRNLPPSECVSRLVTDTITSTEDATSQLPALSQSSSSERQLDSCTTQNTRRPNAEHNNEASPTSVHRSLYPIIDSVQSDIHESLSSSNTAEYSASGHEINDTTSAGANQDQNEEHQRRHSEPPSPNGTTDPQRDDHADSPSEAHTNARPSSRFFMYIPEQASPFPFPLLSDVGSNLVWPIIDCIERTRNQDTGEESTRLVHVLGMPFHLTFTMRPSDPNDVPDSNKARAYVESLERVDAELRSRMAHFSITSASVESSNDASMQHVSGCGVCLEPYPIEDKPAWFTEGTNEPDETVVAIPCHGFHTIHASCLVEWLSSKAPSQWSCPYCRAPLRSNAKHNPPPMTLREYVKQKEREHGWRCDAPTCFPCYSDGEKHESPLIKLMPCRHEIHLDCLCTNMRIEMAYSGARSYTDCEEDTDDDDTNDSMTEERESAPHLDANVHLASDLTQNCTENDTIGKWLTCSVCRRDAWALLPRRQRPRRSLHRSLHGLVS